MDQVDMAREDPSVAMAPLGWGLGGRVVEVLVGIREGCRTVALPWRRW